MKYQCSNNKIKKVALDLIDADHSCKNRKSRERKQAKKRASRIARQEKIEVVFD
jgi:hypothetical protein